MRDIFYQIREAINQIEDLDNELGDMCAAWESDDPCAQACNDPGLQFGKEMEIERAEDDLKELLREYLKEN